MGFFLTVHKLALVLSILLGVICAFKFKNKGKKIHGLLALITVISILIYLIQSHFDSLGYTVYGLLLLSSYVVGKYVKHKRSFLGHIILFVISIIWLVVIHVV